MKNYIYRTLLILALAVFTLPILSQDYMNIHFKNGDHRKFYMKNITEIAASKVDKDGVEHSDYCSQKITTIYDTYVYNLEDIDSITFTKYYDEKVKQDFHSAMSVALPTLSNCQNIQEAEQVLEQIKNADGVEDAWSDGHQLYMKISNWETISFHFNHYDETDSEETNNSVEKIRSLIPQIKKMVGTKGEKPRVVIANQQHHDIKRLKQRKRLMTLRDEFEQYGFDADYEDCPDLFFFSTRMFTYDVVFLMTHGDFDGYSHSFLSSEELGNSLSSIDYNEEIPQSLTDEWKEKMIKTYENTRYGDFDAIYYGWVIEWRSTPHWVGYINIYEKFFDKKENGGKTIGIFRPNSLFFNGACLSLKGNSQDTDSWHSLADKLIENQGLGVYYGYDESNYYGSKAGCDFLRSMLQGKCVYSAYEGLSDLWKVETDKPECAALKQWPNTDEADNLFFFSVNTNAISDEQASNNFNIGQYVEVEGVTTTSNPNSLSYGFVFGDDENFTIGHLETTNFMQLSSVTEKGNLLFKLKVKGLKRGNTYFYKAFTHDGQRYNYGNTCSFTIKDHIPSYTKCPDNNHPHLIDLGLPSGTLWSCCNVGATKPEEYGNYYAWGETSEKSVYDWSTYAHCDGSEETCHDMGSDIGGTGYDAAKANWGLPWRIPSQEQLNELTSNCKYENVTLNGVNGGKFSSNHNNGYIFLPAAGGRTGSSLIDANTKGYYWTSSANTPKPSTANALVIGGQPNISNDRCYGRSIRPVVAQ